jgi:ubiquinone/menaquinone biosynthesis C-methylase UbiE
MKGSAHHPKISIYRKIESGISIFRAHRNGISMNSKTAVMDHRHLRDYMDRYIVLPFEQIRILDIGCGQTAIQTALFHADGANITGIDIEVPTYRMSFSTFFQIVKRNGFERALKSSLRHILFDKQYFSKISQEYGKQLNFNGMDIRLMDATYMPFGSETFDFIYSRAVLEHVRDVEAPIREINRILTPRGFAVMNIHLFPSISGGHRMEWRDPDRLPSTTVLPWDHLRDNKFPANTYLNKLKINQYREILKSHVNILEEQTLIEGEKLLTREIEEELGGKGYTREDLLTSTVIFCINKRMTASSPSSKD